MKRIVFTLVLAILVISGSAQDFRKASWGDNQSTVKNSEPDQEWTQDFTELYEIWSFTTSISSQPADVNYCFVEDRLVKYFYYFTVEHSNGNDYIDDFENIGKSLQSKYGHVERQDNWRNNLYKKDPSKHGYALSSGHYEMTRQWEIEGKTIIRHRLVGGWKIFHYVEYCDIKFKDYGKQE